MEQISISEQHQIWLRSGKTNISIGQKSEDFHHSLSWGNRSQSIEYHITDHSNPEVKRDRFILSYGTINRLFVYCRSQQKRLLDSIFSGIRNKASIKWDDVVLVPSDCAESLFEFNGKESKHENRPNISRREAINLLQCPCVLENLKEREGFVAYKWKGNTFQFHGIVIGFPKTKGFPVQVLFISKRQMERWENRVKSDIENIINRDNTPERQDYLALKANAAITESKNLPQLN